MSTFGYMRYQPYGLSQVIPTLRYPYGLLQLYKPHSADKQVYAHTQQLGLQSARFVQRGKRNRTLTLPRFHYNSLHRAKRTHRGSGFQKRCCC